jgi:hypothetical protein
MIHDIDIWRAANLLVKRHGADAALTAAWRADDLLAAGKVEGCVTWKRIFEAVAELSRTKPAEGELVKLICGNPNLNLGAASPWLA